MKNISLENFCDKVIEKANVINDKKINAASKEIMESSAAKFMTEQQVKDLLLKLHPVGSVEIRLDEVNPGTLWGGTWEKQGKGRVIQAKTDSQTVGNTVDAGLPNITGVFRSADVGGLEKSTGCFNNDSNFNVGYFGSEARGYDLTVSFNASRSSSIYGKSSTVQPPALLVNIWKRTK